MGLWGVIFNKSYVRWKILLSLGTALWVMLCLYDAYLVDPVTKFYYSDSDQYQWLAQVADEEIIPEVVPQARKDNIHFAEEVGFGVSLLLWNAFTFLLTFLICALAKVAIAHSWDIQDFYRRITTSEPAEAVSKKSSGSKIPVLLSSKSATTSTQENACETKEKETQIERNPSFLKIDRETQPSGNFLKGSASSIDLTRIPNRDMEKQCAKLRDEMIYMQTSSLKEHAALSRKLELVAKEKRDLTRQLMVTQKENRAAKMQLEELLNEKSMLIKRLESATKEFKTNTKSKKQLLAKLEESQATIASLKKEVEKISKEKEILRNKLQVLDSEYTIVKERLGKFEKVEMLNLGICEKDNPEPKKDATHTPKDDKVAADVLDITQSQRDVQRVQMRLINLEKSLDKLKLCKLPQKENALESTTESDLAKSEQTDSENEYTYCTAKSDDLLDEGQISMRHCDNLTDEQRRIILSPRSASGEEYFINTKQLSKFLGEFGNENSYQRAETILNYLKESSTPRDGGSMNSSDEQPVTDTNSGPDDDRNIDEWKPPKNRFVSHSTAFKKFLKSMSHLDKNHKKMTASNIF